MSFSLPTIEQENRQRIQQYWRMQAHHLQGDAITQVNTETIVKHGSSDVVWEGEHSHSGCSTIKNKQSREADVLCSADSIIQGIVNLPSGVTVESVEVPEARTPRMRYMCSIEQQLDKMQSSHGKQGENKNTEVTSNENKNRWAGIVKYANSYSERTVSDLVHPKLSSALEIKLFQSREPMKLERETDDQKPISEFRAQEFGMDSQQREPIYSIDPIRESLGPLEQSNPITSKINNMNSNSRMLKNRAHAHSFTTPIYVAYIPPVSATEVQVSSPPMEKKVALSPIDKILKIDRLLEMSKTSHKTSEFDHTAAKYRSEPKTKLEIQSAQSSASKTGRKAKGIKLELVSVKSKEKEMKQSKFFKLTNIYDEQLAKNNIKVEPKRERNKQIGGDPELFARCPCPFRIGNPCVDTVTEKEDEKKEKHTLDLQGLSLQPSIPSQTLTSTSRPYRHHKGLDTHFKSTDLA